MPFLRIVNDNNWAGLVFSTRSCLKLLSYKPVTLPVLNYVYITKKKKNTFCFVAITRLNGYENENSGKSYFDLRLGTIQSSLPKYYAIEKRSPLF